MKFLFDFFPIALFFISYKFWGIYVATLAAILGTLGQVLWGRFHHGRFEKIPLLTLAILVLMGGATLLFRNELFIKWKPTVIYWVLALIFALTHWIGSKPAIQRLAEQSIQLKPPIIWYRLNLSWILFFFTMGLANIYVLQNFDTDTWVNFKLFGTLGLTLIFVLGQGVYMIRHRLCETTEETGETKS